VGRPRVVSVCSYVNVATAVQPPVRRTHVFDDKDGPPRDLAAEVLEVDGVLLLDAVAAERLVAVGEDAVGLGRQPLADGDELEQEERTRVSEVWSTCSCPRSRPSSRRTRGNLASTAPLSSSTVTAFGCREGKSISTAGRAGLPPFLDDDRGWTVILTMLIVCV
jgi:hypothetical protein